MRHDSNGKMRVSINIPPSHCPVCGKGRNQYTNHTACAKKMQALRLEANKERSR